MRLFAISLSLVSAIASAPAYAQVMREAKVLSSTPIIGQVATTRESCREERVYRPGNTSGLGAIIGGLTGAVVGNQFGKGDGRALATVAGGVAGGFAGNSMESPGPGSTVNEVRCGPQVVTETRTLGFQVVYELDGQQYNVRMDREPGPKILIQ